MTSFSICRVCTLILVVILQVLHGNAESFYSFQVKDIFEQDVELNKFDGKVSLVVNVATNCGFTESHYKDLVRLQDMLSVDKDGKNVFNVMAFPSNEFGGQEPGPNEMIFQYATDNYGLNFPLFAKVNVRQEDVSPPWKFLTDSAERVPNWNFWKYLVGRDGNIIDAWGPHTSVDKIVTYIQKALAGEPQPKTEAKRTQEQSSADHKKAEDEL